MWEINGHLTDDEAEVMKYFNLKYPPMVKGLDDTDLYKFSMGQVYHHYYPGMITTWDFRARNVGDGTSHEEKYTAEDREEITNQLRAYCALRFEQRSLDFLTRRCPWIKFDYIHFLKNYRPEFESFHIGDDKKVGLSIYFEGVQEYNTYHEIPVLQITDETYYRNHYDYDKLLKEYKEKTEEKIAKMNSGDYHFGFWSEFGARRRLSYEAQSWLITRLADEKKKGSEAFKGFVGTSDVRLAMLNELTPVGTCAHEFIECVGQGDPMINPAYSNKYAIEAWVKEYGIMNGTWLTDTIGDELCRRDMKLTYSVLFGGVRNDSGDPFAWADNWIDHFTKLYNENRNEYRVNPKNKTLLFSNSIDSLELWDKLCRYVEGRAVPAFGIGTYWSGPQSIPALNQVAKVVLVNGMHVAKLSDDSGKTMSRSPEYVDYLRRVLDWRLASGN